jgi:superfamily II DNA or RNA helicase
MDKFPENVTFKGKWRPYQARVLSELEEHLDDDRLHVVAAPGSGKTLLGLEVIRRINSPTLILSPTLAIKDQWINRFMTFYLAGATKVPEWISQDLKSPKLLTITTYQSLHEARKEEKKEDEVESESQDEKKERNIDKLITILNNAGIRTIVVDEAHHLRNEWWETLTAVRNGLANAKIVALTATPPLDVSQVEWNRYRELCGPLDSEVPVPELVLEGNLCPHQDYVLMSYPTLEERLRISEFRKGIQDFIFQIRKNKKFIDIIKDQPWMNEPEAHLDFIFSNPAYISSCVIFLDHEGIEIPKQILDVLGIKRKEIPDNDLEWMEILLSNILFLDTETYTKNEKFLKEILRDLDRLGTVDRKNVRLTSSKKIDKILVSSITKLDSIDEIIKHEYESLKQDLRLVVLTDFIRKSDMPKTPDDLKPLNRLGVVPIFERIRREKQPNMKLGVLCGSLVIIPKSAESEFRSVVERSGVDPSRVSLKPLKYDEDFFVVDISGEHSQKIVDILTQVFSSGEINILVGTKSLLGEGWDAPSINTLILASYVGSFMLSNQMRGRAIRSLPDDPDKTANIWHLLCVEPRAKKPGEDLKMLTRRFKAFVGVSFKESLITNGIDRLDIGDPPIKKSKMNSINKIMLKKARGRQSLIKAWDEALHRGEDGFRLYEEINVPKEAFSRGFLFSKTIKAFLIEGLGWTLVVLYALYPYATSLIGLAILGLALAAVSLPYLIKSLYLIVKYGPVGTQIKQIGEALLRTLKHKNLIKTDIYMMGIKTETNDLGEVYCTLGGGTFYEKNLFLDSLQEILDPIENPRYIIMRTSWFGSMKRTDYHAVPKEIGAQKRSALYFKKMWRKYVGPCELIYTRSKDGRRKLLHARGNTLSHVFQKRSQRLNRWR